MSEGREVKKIPRQEYSAEFKDQAVKRAQAVATGTAKRKRGLVDCAQQPGCVMPEVEWRTAKAGTRYSGLTATKMPRRRNVADFAQSQVNLIKKANSRSIGANEVYLYEILT
jgi:hypothetical protein